MTLDLGLNECIETEAYSIRLSSYRKMTSIIRDRDKIDTRSVYFLFKFQKDVIY